MGLLGWVFWLFVVAFVIAGIIGWNKGKRYLETSKNIASNLDNFIQKESFIVDKRITAGDGILLIDSANKKWCAVSNKNAEPIIYDYNDLTEYEVYEDGNSIAKGRSGSAAVGGLFFGTTGAIMGSAGSKAIQNTCSIMQVRIRLNDLSNPEITISLIGGNSLNTEMKKDSSGYRNLLDSAKQMVSYLSYIQNNGKEIKPEMQSVIESGTTADEIRKYKELLDIGAITQEEYENKKKQLLNV